MREQKPNTSYHNSHVGTKAILRIPFLGIDKVSRLFYATLESTMGSGILLNTDSLPSQHQHWNLKTWNIDKPDCRAMTEKWRMKQNWVAQPDV
ncbi:hypothetical protein E2C01_018118 [Portunus trituberculatus]|uniref:Uncharacterized protein n=1 Tax=Portunus trituberculatus TaxID=210409 RepID=A0A5B7DTP0_PORTR|nr:hypothetical protein [Portunus trituberculatus]